MKYYFKLIITIFIFVTNNGCKSDKDKYYTEIREFGLIRFPTIPPYIAGSTEGLNGPWFLLDSIYSGEEIHSLDVVDTIIVAFYYNKYILVPENIDTTWYIIIPNMKGSYYFKNEKKFFDKLSLLTNKKPHFREASDLWLEFKNKGYLEWFPEEYKK